MASKSGYVQNLGKSLAGARLGPGGVRREDGASLICGYYTKRGKACADTVLAPRKGAGARGSAPSSGNCEASSTDADALADQLVVVMKHL